MSEFSPREIVSELDRHIIGQHDAKRAVAIGKLRPISPMDKGDVGNGG